MEITKQRFINIHKYALIAGIAFYLYGIFISKSLQLGIIFVLAVSCFNLLQLRFFQGRPRLAAHTWLVPALVAIFTSSVLMEKEPGASKPLYTAITLIISLIPLLLLATGKAVEKASQRPRLEVVNFRIIVQTLVFTLYLAVSANTWILGTKHELLFWGMFHVFTVAIFPFLFGRMLCGWLCPNATLQDALHKNLTYKRPISRLPRAIEEQSHTTAMYLREGDKSAPFFPFTLLLAWFPMFFTETVFDLTPVPWYPTAFLYGLLICSFLLPWRKLCTHFCWLSSYRGLAGQASLWRIRYNKSNCKDCKVCFAEAACPFYIDIRNQDNEMPATCCLCFSCMEACPAEGCLTFRRAKEEKERIRAIGTAA